MIRFFIWTFPIFPGLKSFLKVISITNLIINLNYNNRHINHNFKRHLIFEYNENDDTINDGDCLQDLTIKSTYTLNNGVKIPILGLGTYQAANIKKIEDAVLHALQVGYRLIDTARMYGNETEVGRAVKRSGIPREEIFITTKVWFTDFGYDNVFKSFNKSLEDLNMKYVDLLLIHWPIGGRLLETWKAFEKLYKEEKCRAIGVSNFKINHLKKFLEESSIVPTINQVEFHPFLYQEDSSIF